MIGATNLTILWSASLVAGAALELPAGRVPASMVVCAVQEMNRPSPMADPKAAPGTWGGEHVRLRISGEGVELEFDCAHGTISGPVRLDDGGRFEIAGVYVRENPGPIRVGSEPKAQPASYSGSIKENTMILRVTLSDSRETIGTYALTLGSEGRVRKCR